MEELIEQSIIISLAIVGLRIVSSKGMILHFLRMPYEWLLGMYDFWEEEYQNTDDDEVEDYCRKHMIKFKVPIYILKPIIGCTTCMASVYTILISYLYFEVTTWTVLQIFIVACLNSIIMAYYEKLNK